MAGWGHAVDPYTIVEIEYDFQFETDPIHHRGKVALSFVLAKATLLAMPDITVKRTLLRKGVESIPAEAWVTPADVDVPNEVRMGMMAEIHRAIETSKARDNKEADIELATAAARGSMLGSWNAFCYTQRETA